MKSRDLKVKIRILALVLSYMMVHIWILLLLHQLKASEDLLALSYPAEELTDTAFLRWKKTDGGRKVEKAAVWKSCGKLSLYAESVGHQERVCCYQMLGQPEAVFGKTLAAGRYFTKEEENVCLLDMETIRALFGSEDVLGLEVKLNGKTLQIIGILNESAPVCVIPAEEGTTFEGIVLRRQDAGESSRLAVSLTEAVFGEAEGQIIDGKLYYVTACVLYGIMTAAFFIIIGIMAGRGGKRRNIRKVWKPERGICFLCIGIGAAVLYIGIKRADPGSDYLPPYWSDFDFFGRLFEEKTWQIQQLLAHQEFPCWQRMAHSWRQVIGLEIAGAILQVIFLTGIENSRIIYSPHCKNEY